jgi:predicted GIY-YIG superfamily endonuclease
VKSTYYVYILACADGSLYTGIATDVERRLAEHNSSLNGAKYTKSRRPVSLVYQEKCKNRSEALKREYEIKQLSRQQKLTLIKDA